MIGVLVDVLVDEVGDSVALLDGFGPLVRLVVADAVGGVVALPRGTEVADVADLDVLVDAEVVVAFVAFGVDPVLEERETDVAPSRPVVGPSRPTDGAVRSLSADSCCWVGPDGRSGSTNGNATTAVRPATQSSGRPGSGFQLPRRSSTPCRTSSRR